MGSEPVISVAVQLAEPGDDRAQPYRAPTTPGIPVYARRGSCLRRKLGPKYAIGCSHRDELALATLVRAGPNAAIMRLKRLRK